MADIDIAYSEVYGSYLAISADYLQALGEEFLAYVKDGMKITVKLDGTVEVDG